MTIIPVTLTRARQFVAEHHRHNGPPQGWLFGVGLEDDNELVGVAIAGRPVARALDDGRTVEITRVCTVGDRNANSMLYGAVCRAARDLGYRRVVTYTLESESGASLRAAGFAIGVPLDMRETWATSIASAAGHRPMGSARASRGAPHPLGAEARRVTLPYLLPTGHTRLSVAMSTVERGLGECTYHTERRMDGDRVFALSTI